MHHNFSKWNTTIFQNYLHKSIIISTLKAYTADQYATVSYYNDRYGLEADVVLHLDDGRYALIECKLGSAEMLFQ